MEICLLYIGTSRSAKVTSKTVFKKKGAGAVRRTAVLAAGEHRRKSLLHTALPWGIPGGMSRRQPTLAPPVKPGQCVAYVWH